MLKSLNYAKRKTKIVTLCTEPPHAIALFALVGVDTEIIVLISSKARSRRRILGSGFGLGLRLVLGLKLGLG